MENILAWLVIGGLVSIPILNMVAKIITWYAKKKTGKQIDIIPYPVVNYSEKTWFELEQYYRKYFNDREFIGLKDVERARFNLLYKEKRYRQAIEHAMESMLLEAEILRQICFTRKEWENTKETAFCLYRDERDAIIYAGITEQELVDMFLNSRVRLPFPVSRQEYVKAIRKNYKEIQTQ